MSPYEEDVLPLNYTAMLSVIMGTHNVRDTIMNP